MLSRFHTCYKALIIMLTHCHYYTLHIIRLRTLLNVIKLHKRELNELTNKSEWMVRHVKFLHNNIMPLVVNEYSIMLCCCQET